MNIEVYPRCIELHITKGTRHKFGWVIGLSKSFVVNIEKDINVMHLGFLYVSWPWSSVFMNEQN